MITSKRPSPRLRRRAIRAPPEELLCRAAHRRGGAPGTTAHQERQRTKNDSAPRTTAHQERQRTALNSAACEALSPCGPPSNGMVLSPWITGVPGDHLRSPRRRPVVVAAAEPDSGLQEGLDRAALVHRAVALGRVVERQGQ